MRLTFSAPKTVLLHSLVWAGWVVYEQATFFITGGPQYSVWLVAFTMLLNILLFYANTEVLLPRLYAWHRHWHWSYLVGGVGLLAIYAGLRYAIAFHLAPSLGIALPSQAIATSTFLLTVIYRGTFFVLTGTGYWFARHLLNLEQMKLAQEHQLRLAERSLLESQLAFLRSQINPHLLFNSLNALYAHVYPHSEEAAKGILLLADTMRYALHEPHHGKVALSQEVTHLHNYIALHQLRFHQRLCVDFTVSGNVQLLLIVPLLLLTFVENGFQHGELLDDAHPLTIRLAMVQNHLTFSTHNKKRQGPKTPGLGIGLANTTQRLAQLYPGCHELTVRDEPEYYSCHLTLTL